MSLLLFIIGLLSSTDAFYHVLTDSSGISSYMAHISATSTDTFDLIIYTSSSYGSSPICSDCIIFNATLKTPNITITRNALVFHIKSDPILETHNIYLFFECPLLLTISIALPSYHIQYIQHTPTLTNHRNTDEYQCVFQQQTDESSDTIHYIEYHKPNHIQSYQYYLPLTLHQQQQHILTPFNTSNPPHILYCNNILYFVFLSSKQSVIVLNVASYNFMDKIWHRNDNILRDIHFNTETSIEYIGIHLMKSNEMPMLHILFHSISNHTYEILSWLMHTDIYYIHEYKYNTDSIPIVINDYNIHWILSPPIRQHFVYYNNINTFVKTLSLSGKYMQISSTKRQRRLQKTDPECQDVSANCAHIVDDCDDEGIGNICRATCGQCEQRAFNCSDYTSSANTVDICQFPKETPSFCADPDGWFLYFCPITCHHPNCTQYWITMNPTSAPTIKTTRFDSTEITDIPSQIQTQSIDEDEMSTTIVIADTDVITETERNVVGMGHSRKDMTLILILLAVLLGCIFVASVLLWICVNIVRMQRDHNYIVYNAVAAMSSRTPDFYTHPGVAPSTPDYYRTDLHSHQHRGSFQRG